MADIGRLQVQVFRVNTAIPVTNANIVITRAEGETREQVAALTTNTEGQTTTIEVETPDIERSLNPLLLYHSVYILFSVNEIIQYTFALIVASGQVA